MAGISRTRRGTPNSEGMPSEGTKHRKGVRKGRVGLIVAVCIAMITSTLAIGGPAAVAAAPVGEGFTVSPADLAYILKQIKIAEAHVANTTALTGPCGALLGTGPDQIQTPALPEGLRTVDGTCNNLQPGQSKFGASSEVFPRLTTPSFRAADTVPPGFGPPSGPGAVGSPTSYAQTKGLVFDAQPRDISNLIVDQTSTNPAAIAAAGFPVRTQGNDGVEPCITEPTTPGGTDGLPAGCVPAYQTLFIPNVTTDVGLSPPFNSLFTIFGQFFDHGVDKIVNGGSGTVFVPLREDDPLVAGDNHIFGDADDIPPSLRFMTITRSTNRPGPDGVTGDNLATPLVDESADDIHEALNVDTPFVDQSQTYTSHSSHQVFLREYVDNTGGKPVATGKLLHSADGGMSTWAQVKAQAATKLGLQLTDADVGNIPMIAADPYGKFIPGALRGLPQYVTETGLVEGDRAVPVLAPANVKRISMAFLNDIAHSAAPKGAPDEDLTAGESLDTPICAGGVPSGSVPGVTCYDNELLDAHFMAGDGRVNENIALTAIHQIFHSEHDRLVDDMKNTILTNAAGPDPILSLSDWQTPLGAADANGVWNGERMFQAARFVTEMEYQHLVFEEFARKVQPDLAPFQAFALTETDINPAVVAEYAHAVYRFGHSMLTETISRTNEDGSSNDIPLFDGFLDPLEYTKGGSAGTLNSQQAAGSIIMGMSDQTGNEIDEFVTDVLRNHLVGLPQDLPAINMARARAEGIPSLNNLRKQLHAKTNDGALTPYQSWTDFGLAMKHPESLINFVAAYGTHPTITAATTLTDKRAAARAIVNPLVTDVMPADAPDFMDSSGDWANTAGNVSITGLDQVDLWVGGLAENTNLFGGLLGSTFNYVFENQLLNLQNADRLYYLTRTPGMNLRAQLEGNSFAELMMRNTTAHSLKADPFATADCKFQLSHLAGTPQGYTDNGQTVADDPGTECDETALLIRRPDGQIRYRAINSVDPPGINGQSVYNGTSAVDKIYGGNDNDTFLGNEGADIIDGGGGDDIAIGGAGNDIITDFAGADVPKGGPGNDAIDSGPGIDIVMGGDGYDFMNGGANDNELFGGSGNDYMIGGQGVEDAMFGDSGDDWIEGDIGTDLLIGDSSSFLFDDHNLPGNDIFYGQSGDDDYDMEGGDDIGVSGPGIEKNAGAAGWDWSINLNDPQPADADLDLTLVGVPLGVNGVRDRYNEVESLSGWKFDDKLRGDSVIPSQVGGGGFIGCDALDQKGLDRISGLDPLVPPLTVPSAPIIAASSTNFCRLTGNVWGEGNIILGGGGSDLIEGRGGDDIIDGDHYMSVRISLRDAPNSATEIGSTDLMEHAAVTGNFGPGTAGMTLQQAVFAGKVDPGNLVNVREILDTSGTSPG